MWPWIGRQRYDGVQEEGVVLRSSRRLGASPRKVNVMSRDLITVSEDHCLGGWVGPQDMCISLEPTGQNIYKNTKYTSRKVRFFYVQISIGVRGSLGGVSLSAKKYV